MACVPRHEDGRAPRRPDAIDEQVKPLRAAQESQNVRTAADETTRVMADLVTRHPDWETHEPAMLELAKTLDPKGLTESAYLDVLYDVVTTRSAQTAWQKDKATQVAAEVKKTIAKMEADAGRGRTARATPEAQVSKRPPSRRGFVKHAPPPATASASLVRFVVSLSGHHEQAGPRPGGAAERSSKPSARAVKALRIPDVFHP